ncbi:alpha/beta hydrolase [Agromyces bracchium]|uniref:Alpha/beta hydrolase fold domain-containing protein n=1 Tax=Agromyces bracchium TaxID=88376 RepID=A0A6I3MFG0_9MICO|nr:alpha/beta hydrolase fold domain-containing protein [Agromyces bracchium]MTH70086.1 alpha/beta hydrolase fold domain-containing protein [Agromyces bracchium]
MTQQTPYAAADGLVRVYPADAAAARPTPALVWAHGGGFAAGDLDMPEADWVARAFTARGVAVVSIDYRLAVDAAGRYPAGSDDVLAAWAWTAAHADELGIDPARIVVGGASAGANLTAGAVLRTLGIPATPDSAGGADRFPSAAVEAAPGPDALSAERTPLPAGVFLAYPTLLAVQPAPDAALRAMLDANPVADRFGPARVREMYEAYLGGPVEDAPLPAVPGRATAADLAGFPPVLMVNGEADELRVSGEAFAATLAAAGVPNEVVTEPGTEHGHLNRPGEPAASVTVERVLAWLTGLDTGAPRPTRPPHGTGAPRPTRPPHGTGASRPTRPPTPTTVSTTEGITS